MKTFELNVEAGTEETRGLTIREVIEKIEAGKISGEVAKPISTDQKIKVV